MCNLKTKESMKRLMMMAVLVLTVLTAWAQGGIGKAAGWAVDVSTDDFSGEKTYRCMYYDQQKVLTAVYWPQSGAMTLVDWYDGKLYFDVTFDAVMDNRGHIADRYISYEIHVNLPKGESREDDGTAKMGFSDVSRAGEVFMSMFNINPTLDDLKRGTSLAVRYEDPIKGRQVVKKVSLSGFTKCFEDCARRSVQDMIKK